MRVFARDIDANGPNAMWLDFMCSIIAPGGAGTAAIPRNQKLALLLEVRSVLEDCILCVFSGLVSIAAVGTIASQMQVSLRMLQGSTHKQVVIGELNGGYKVQYLSVYDMYV